MLILLVVARITISWTHPHLDHSLTTSWPQNFCHWPAAEHNHTLTTPWPHLDHRTPVTDHQLNTPTPWPLHFQRLSPSPFIMGAGKWPQILKLGDNTYSLSWPDFWFLSNFFCHVTLKLAVTRSWPPVPYGANLFYVFVNKLCITFQVNCQFTASDVTLSQWLLSLWCCCFRSCSMRMCRWKRSWRNLLPFRNVTAKLATESSGETWLLSTHQVE